MNVSFLNFSFIRSYNINVAKHLGSVTAAIMLSELIQRRDYHEKNKELTNCPKHGENWFYYTVDMGLDRLCLSKKEQETALNKLIAFGYVEKVSFGLPARRHFRINVKKIMEDFSDSKKVSRKQQSCQLDGDKVANRMATKSPTDTYIEEESQEEYHQHHQRKSEKSESKTGSVPIDDDDGINANSELLNENGNKKMLQTFAQDGKDKQPESSMKQNPSTENSQALAAQIDFIMENVKKSKYPYFTKFFIAKHCKIYGPEAVKSVLRGMFYKKTDAQLARLTNPEGVFVSQITEFYPKLEYNK